MKLVQDLWRGKHPLWLTFWGFYVAGYLVTMLLVQVISPHFAAQPWRWLVVALLIVPYGVLFAVGVWRSADAYPLTRWWPNMAKIAVLLWSVRIAWSMGNGTLKAWAEWMG